MIDTNRKDDIPRHGERPLFYIVERKDCKPWVTVYAVIADKHRAKPDTVVTEYYSKL